MFLLFCFLILTNSTNWPILINYLLDNFIFLSFAARLFLSLIFDHNWSKTVNKFFDLFDLFSISLLGHWNGWLLANLEVEDLDGVSLREGGDSQDDDKK